MAASGKSTFAKLNPDYNGYHVVDFEVRLPARTLWTRLVLYASRVLKPVRILVSGRPDQIARSQKNYFSRVFEYIINHQEPLVVFGRRTPENFEELSVHDSIRFAMVMIPEEEHRRNCASRKRELRNPFPFLHHWTTDFDKIRRMRLSVTDYANRHNIVVYDSFTAAIDDLHKRYALRHRTINITRREKSSRMTSVSRNRQ